MDFWNKTQKTTIKEKTDKVDCKTVPFIKVPTEKGEKNKGLVVKIYKEFRQYDTVLVRILQRNNQQDV